MHVCYTDRCIYSQGVDRTYQRALERGFGGVGGRFNLYLEYDLEVELILNFLNAYYRPPRATATQPSTCCPLRGRPERGGECS